MFINFLWMIGLTIEAIFLYFVGEMVFGMIDKAEKKQRYSNYLL